MGAMYTQRAAHCPWLARCTMRMSANSAHAVLPDPVGAATRQLSSEPYSALNTCTCGIEGSGPYFLDVWLLAVHVLIWASMEHVRRGQDEETRQDGYVGAA